jgi:hypothetical protein
MGSGERVGKGASFKSVVLFDQGCPRNRESDFEQKITKRTKNQTVHRNLRFLRCLL